MTHWAKDAVFYHIYTLGFCGAPERNDFGSAPVRRLEKVYEWIDHMQHLGVDAVYLGPVFESTAHGYDTADYFWVDRRLGDNDTLRDLVAELHSRGMRVILDGVFNHVGRDFWAFRDLREKGQESPYRDWFRGLRFDHRSPYGDPFAYEGWEGHYDLVRLDLSNPAVRAHLFQAVGMWMNEFGIDGLRLDVAYLLDHEFLGALAMFCRERRPDFWLVGEVLRGDYRQWANPETLDSVTNYECYKGLYSSHVDRNYFEIAYALNRQFGDSGLYRGMSLYNFADNHDVNRVASNLTRREHLYPLYCLLFTMPGVPSIYYGSEWGIEGKRAPGDDSALRPSLDLPSLSQIDSHRDLASFVARLARIRHDLPALRHGSYRQLHVSSEQLAYARETPDQLVLVAVNAADRPATLELKVPEHVRGVTDVLNPSDSFEAHGGLVRVETVPPNWGRILVAE